MTPSDDQILPICYYWASKLLDENISFDELVNVGYIWGRSVDNPKLLQQWIKFKMLHFIMYESRGVRKDSPGDVKSISLEDLPEIVDKYYGSIDEITEMRGDLNNVIMTTCTEEESNVIYMRYWEEKKVKDIAKILGITSPSVCVKIKNILKKIRIGYEQRR